MLSASSIISLTNLSWQNSKCIPPMLTESEVCQDKALFPVCQIFNYLTFYTSFNDMLQICVQSNRKTSNNPQNLIIQLFYIFKSPCISNNQGK